MDSLIVLVHSPLTRSYTWIPVAQHLRALGHETLVPTLADCGKTPPPYWRQHAESVQRALASIPQERPLVFVGHSGAGCLLPVIAQTAQHPTKAYLFVDAGLPHPGRSRLAEMEISVPAFANDLRTLLLSGERFPQWSDDDLCEELPDAPTRARILSELQPRPLAFFEEIMPDIPGWPDASGGYLLFTAGYQHARDQALRYGWPSRVIRAGHFHLLVDPAAVAMALIELMPA